MTKKNSEILILNNLSVNYDRLLAWTREDNFPVKKITDKENSILKDIAAIFIAFEGNQGRKILHNGSNIYDHVHTNFNDFVNRFLTQFHTPSYIVITEQGIGVKNRIRSHKGLLPRQLKETSSYIELEVPISEHYTFIVAIVELTSINKEYLISNFLNNYTSCILNSFEKEFFSEEFLKIFPKKYMSHDGTSTINFLSLLLDLCRNNRSICRIGGDGGDEELSFQIFCKNNIKDLLFIQAENSLLE
jgi:hypothetical protein